MSFKFGIVKKSLMTALNLADKHPFSMGHRVLTVGTLICKCFQAVIDRALVFSTALLLDEIL